jgi:hypothetical protein
MKHLRKQLSAFFLAIFTLSMSGAQMAPMATMTIEGKVKEIVWHKDRELKGLPGLSGSAGQDRTVPAHYQVKLEETTVEANGEGFVPFEAGKPIEVKLDHAKDDGHLKKGMKIRISGFRMNGDEGGVRMTYEKIEILSGASGE